MNDAKHRRNESPKSDRFSTVATCLFLATTATGLGFDVAHAHTKPTGKPTAEPFPDQLVDDVVSPTVRKAVAGFLPWHHDVDNPTPKRTVVASPSTSTRPLPARAVPTVGPTSAPTAKVTRTPASSTPRPTPAKPSPKPKPKPTRAHPDPHKGHPGDGCHPGTGRHRKPGGSPGDAYHHHTEASETHGYGRAVTTTKTRIPQVVTRGLLRLSVSN